MKKGHERLWDWFGISRASFLVIPRVLMHEMPDVWQGKMAKLLEEYDQAFDQPDIGSRVQITDAEGHLIPTPAWIVNYRHPHYKVINGMKRREGAKE